VTDSHALLAAYACIHLTIDLPLSPLSLLAASRRVPFRRVAGSLWWLRPDGKTQITIEYLQHTDGSVEPKKIHTVVISTQHAEPLKVRTRRRLLPSRARSVTACLACLAHSRSRSAGRSLPPLHPRAPHAHAPFAGSHPAALPDSPPSHPDPRTGQALD
jgi:hypothetical protein